MISSQQKVAVQERDTESFKFILKCQMSGISKQNTNFFIYNKQLHFASKV